MSRKFFGTDGIRGVAGKSPLDPETMVRLGKALAKVLLTNPGKHRVLIGKDTRLSGYMLETSLCAGIVAMGADVLLCGPIPTPAVAYLTRSMRADAGVVISASHNSFEDNGIKIFAHDGYKLPDALEAQIEEILLSPDISSAIAGSDQIGKATRINDAIGRYTVYLKSYFSREVSLEGLKVGFDGAHGAGYLVGPQVLLELGAEVVSRGVSPNGKNINDGYGSLHPEEIAKVVVAQKLDIGICLDGDGDRCILVDEKGTVHDGDTLLAICALDMKERGALKNDLLVATVMSNLGLEILMKERGINYMTAPVGDRYVLEMMKASGAEVGGEQSGHMIFLQESTTGDGLLTALHVLEIMKRKGKKLSELASSFVRYPQVLINIPVREKIPFEKIPVFSDLLQAKQKEIGSQGRILVRYSGTEVKARVMVEHRDPATCAKYAQELATSLKSSIGV
jgi:phosphoglucosamine mutase